MEKFAKEQLLPIILTIGTFFALCLLFFLSIHILNLFPSNEKIHPQLHLADIVVGLTIYLKTSIDFAIFIANLMHANRGWLKRIAIELGTAIGNALGTILILVIWNFFRQVPILMAIMIVLASLVLLRMAEESIEEFLSKTSHHNSMKMSLSFLNQQLHAINTVAHPILRLLLPNFGLNTPSKSFLSLFLLAVSVPFILGLDDFAGYIPLFSVVNVFGFAVGIFLGHMLLNIGLFLSPRKTTSLVKNTVILAIGGVAFIGIALLGLLEVVALIQRMV